ncbi:MAG: ABC transporter permease [Bacteroidia bacterium]|nr:MAG: ABC transporter permease [Bacteroidia bacterium]
MYTTVNMLLNISWRNIWRNPKRSLVMVVAITAGLWGGISAASLVFGLLEQRFQTSIEQHISHLQIHHPDYLTDQIAEHRVEEWTPLHEYMNKDPEIEAFSMRTKLHGMLSSAHLTSGVYVMGVDPDSEAQTTRIDQNIKEGSYFSEEMQNSVLVGSELAEKSKLLVGSRLVLTFQDTGGDLVSAAFRVAGIFQTANKQFDGSHIYTLRSDLVHYIDSEMVINEVALLANDAGQIHSIRQRYAEAFPGLAVRSWEEIAPELYYMQGMANIMMMFILVIILFALAFGLVNTMLMAVFERSRELGVLMAIGMNKKRVFSMILFETAILSLMGAAGGILASLITLGVFGRRGIDLAVFGGDSLSEFGFPSLVYPTIAPSFILTLMIMVIATALITSIYPALKAVRLLPAEAVKDQ